MSKRKAEDEAVVLDTEEIPDTEGSYVRQLLNDWLKLHRAEVRDNTALRDIETVLNNMHIHALYECLCYDGRTLVGLYTTAERAKQKAEELERPGVQLMCTRHRFVFSPLEVDTAIFYVNRDFRVVHEASIVVHVNSGEGIRSVCTGTVGVRSGLESMMETIKTEYSDAICYFITYRPVELGAYPQRTSMQLYRDIKGGIDAILAGKTK